MNDLDRHSTCLSSPFDHGATNAQQLNRDLSALQPKIDDCTAFISQDPDVSKLIGLVPK
jgi:hypothetical protein